MKTKSYDFSKLFNIKKFHTTYITKLAKENNVGVGCLVFLKALTANAFHTQQELSEFIGCNKAHTSRILTMMYKKGLIQFSPEKNIMLTEQGIELAKKVEKIDREFTNKLLENVAKEDLEIFRKVCKQIYKNSEALSNS